MMQWRLEFAADHPVGAGHFPGLPIVPGALLLERVLAGLGLRLAAGQGADSAAVLCAWQVRAAKFPSPLAPGQTVQIEAVAGANGVWRIAASVDARRVLSAEVRLAPAEAA
jgi:3-hydroxyacyl-[acyl-carrier-protein] dehydratase